MRRRHIFAAAIIPLITACAKDKEEPRSDRVSVFSATPAPVVTIKAIGPDTLTDSASIQQLKPEPDGGSVAFLFTDPLKRISRGLALVETSGTQTVQLVWPDSVLTFWWSGPHQLSFTAGTGEGVRVVIDVHAAELQAIDGSTSPNRPDSVQVTRPSSIARSRAQAFVDSVRIQPQGTPQGSALRYQADSIILAPGDSFAAVHVLATDVQGTRVNPAWYVTHLPSGHVQGIDSLTGRSQGLLATAAAWSTAGVFYYAKERSIWQVHTKAH